MYQSVSARRQAQPTVKRNKFSPRLDLLEGRLAPGDVVLSQLASLSILGSGVTALDAVSESWTTSTSAGIMDGFQVVQADSLGADYGTPALDAAALVTEVTFEQSYAVEQNGDPFLATDLGDPLDDGVFAAVSAAPATRLAVLGGTAAQPVGDGAGNFSGGTLIGEVSQTPQVVAARGADLSQYVQLTVTPLQPAIDPVILEARDGNVPKGVIPPPLDLSVLQNVDHSRGRETLARISEHLANAAAGNNTIGVTSGPDPYDPAARGPLPTTRIEYNLGDTAFQPTDFIPLNGRVEMRASVHYPTGLADGPYPFVVFMHGRHATCYTGASAALEWPCTAGRQTIPSFQGYDYITDVLASHGAIVISISANGINARDNSVNDLGMLARAQLIQNHLNFWNTWSTVGGGPGGIGSSFVGKVDMNNIGTMGHSRGGEGVARHFVYNASLGSPYTITSVLPLAPVDFNRPQIGAAAQMTILPYCDGDVSDLQGMHFHDDARYTLGANDYYYKTVVTVMGANHNYFNTIWTPGLFPAGTFNDSAATTYCTSGAAGSGRLTAPQQRDVGLAWIAGFFRLWNLGHYDLLGYYAGEYVAPPTIPSFDVRVSALSPSADGFRRDVHRVTAANSLTNNTIGGAVTTNGLVTYELCGGPAPQAQHCLVAAQPTSRQPHTVPSARSALRGLQQVRLVWDTPTAFYRNAVPAAQGDVSGFYNLTFRVGLNYADTTRNPLGQAQDFSVELVDSSGNRGSFNASWFGGALLYPPGNPQAGTIPKMILNTVKIPLWAWTVYANVDLTNIRSVNLNFDQTSRGAVFLVDMNFTAY